MIYLPITAYVVAEVADTHQSDAKFKENPRIPATQFQNMNSVVITLGSRKALISPLIIQNGKRSMADSKLL